MEPRLTACKLVNSNHFIWSWYDLDDLSSPLMLRSYQFFVSADYCVLMRKLQGVPLWKEKLVQVQYETNVIYSMYIYYWSRLALSFSFSFIHSWASPGTYKKQDSTQPESHSVTVHLWYRVKKFITQSGNDSFLVNSSHHGVRLPRTWTTLTTGLQLPWLFNPLTLKSEQFQISPAAYVGNITITQDKELGFS